MTEAEAQFFDELVLAMTTPLPKAGDEVLVNGRPGVLVGYFPGGRPEWSSFYTCTTWFDVDHDGEVVEYVANDWNPNKPILEVQP